MIKLEQFLHVIGAGERVRIGLRSMNGFIVVDHVFNLLDTPKLQEYYNYPISNIHSSVCSTGSFMVIELEDIA